MASRNEPTPVSFRFETVLRTTRPSKYSKHGRAERRVATNEARREVMFFNQFVSFIEAIQELRFMVVNQVAPCVFDS